MGVRTSIPDIRLPAAAWIPLAALSCTEPTPQKTPIDTAAADADTDTDTDADTDTDTDADTDPLGCVDSEIGANIPITLSDETEGGFDELAGSCGGNGVPERAYLFTAQADGDYVFDTIGSDYDALLYALEDCTGGELACDDDSANNLQARIRLSLIAGQSVIVAVDGYSGYGTYILNVQNPPSIEEDCRNALDEDLDLLPDCLDPDCEAEPLCARDCPENPASDVELQLVGSTYGDADAFSSYCNGSNSVPSSDESYLFAAPVDGRYVFRLDNESTPFDAILSLQEPCTGYEYTCKRDGGYDETITLDLLEGEEVMAVIDGYRGAAGPYVLDIFQIEETETDCANGIDDDYNGVFDCWDEQCALDTACPEDCADQIDNDTDGEVDCLDLRCEGDPICAASCPEQILEGPLPIAVVGSTLGLGDEWQGSCNDNYASDITYTFTAPAAATYTFDTIGSSYDTILYVLDGCGGTELTCSDDAYNTDSVVQVAMTAGQEVIVVVDGYNQESGSYVLNVQ